MGFTKIQRDSGIQHTSLALWEKFRRKLEDSRLGEHSSVVASLAWPIALAPALANYNYSSKTRVSATCEEAGLTSTTYTTCIRIVMHAGSYIYMVYTCVHCM